MKTQFICFVLKVWSTYPRIHYVSAYPLQSTLRLFLGVGWPSPLRIRISAYPLQTTLRLFLGEGWSSPLRIHASAYLLHDQTTLRLFPGKGWSLPLGIHVSTLFREAPLKWQGILQLGSLADLGGGCRGCAPPPPEMKPSFSYWLLKFIYLTGQWRQKSWIRPWGWQEVWRSVRSVRIVKCVYAS